MKEKVFTFTVTLLFLAGVFIICTNTGKQSEPVASQSEIRAVKGDTVWVLINHVKAEKKEDFESFHTDIFNPILENLTDAVEKANFDKVRFLNPIRQSRDSTYAYVYIADPYARGKSSIPYFLKKKYSEEEAKIHFSQWKNALDRPQEVYSFVETDIAANGKLIRAAEGDTAWILLNRVKPGKEKDFEHFVFDILWSIKDKIEDPKQKLGFTHTRVLKPLKSHEDGSSTYVFFMDPFVSGIEYSFRPIFSRFYRKEQVNDYIAQFGDCLQEPQEGILVIQTKY